MLGTEVASSLEESTWKYTETCFFLPREYDGPVSPVARRSISLPEDVDAAVEAAAVAAGMSVSAWLADLIERHFRI